MNYHKLLKIAAMLLMGLLVFFVKQGWGAYRLNANRETELHAALTTYWQTMSMSDNASTLSQVATAQELKRLQQRGSFSVGVYPPASEAINSLRLREYGDLCSRVEVILIYAGLTKESPASWHSITFLKENGIWKVAYIEQYGVRKTDYAIVAPEITCQTWGY